MARTGRSLPAMTEEQLAAVEAALRRRDLAPRLRERLEMVKAAALGQDLAAIARWSGRSAGTVRRWLSRFAAGGVEALADAPRAGRDVWTSARLSAYLAETTGVGIAPGWLRALLARWDWVCGRPKHTLKHLQDPAAVAACGEVLAAAAGKSGGRAGALRAALPG